MTGSYRTHVTVKGSEDSDVGVGMGASVPVKVQSAEGTGDQAKGAAVVVGSAHECLKHQSLVGCARR